MDALIDNDGDAAEDKNSAESGQLTIPADAVAIDGTPPEAGDTVTFTVDATVISVGDDGTLVVTPVSVNGEPMPQASAPAKKPSERSRLLAMANQADSDQQGY